MLYPSTRNRSSFLRKIGHTESRILLVNTVQLSMAFPFAELCLWADRSLLPPRLSKHRGRNINNAHNRRTYSVGDLCRASSPCKHQTKTTVDDAEYDCNSSNAQMHKCKHCSTSSRFEKSVVQETSHRLREQNDKQNNTDDWMVGSDLVQLSSNVHSQSEGGNEDQIAHGLDRSMKPDETSEVRKSDEDRACWE